jgi:hypothetical protein
VTRRLLLLAVAACGAARLAYLLSPVMQFNADEATTGIMAREILHGREQYVFYAGQDYGGALEQYLEAAVYAVLRLPENPLTLRLPLVALTMATCGLVYLVAREVLTEGRAVVAAGLYAVSPWFNVIGSVTSLGFYAAGPFLSLLALYGALRSARDPRWLLPTGLAAGLAVWTAVTALYLLVPAFVWLVPVLARDARRWAAAAGGFALGAAPLLGWLAAHRRLPVPGDPAEETTVLDRLRNLGGPVVREYLGLSHTYGRGGLWLPVQVAIVLALVAAYVVALRRRGWLLPFLRGRGTAADVLLAVPPVVLVLYAASDSTWYVGTPRYLALTYPVLAVGLAALVPPLARVAVPALAACAALAWTFFPTMATGGSTTTQRDAVLREVADTLAAEGHTSVYANYWTAMPLQYAAGDRITVATLDGVHRFPAAQARVAADPAAVYVGSDHDGSTARIRADLDRRHLSYRTRRVAFVTVFDELPAGAAGAPAS